MKYRRWRVTVKEVGRDSLLYPSVLGNYTKEEVIAFLGLNEPDVEWYRIEDLDAKESTSCHSERSEDVLLSDSEKSRKH